MHLREIVSVGIGGFVGAVLRYEVSGWVQHWSGSVRFPYGTLAVNILGSLIIGTLSELVEGSGFLGPQARAMLLVGMVGAFTTFSTLCSETYNLLRAGEGMAAALNVGGSSRWDWQLCDSGGRWRRSGGREDVARRGLSVAHLHRRERPT